MRKFTIAPIACPELEQAAREKIDNLTKPKGSLGRLEELALQVCMIQQTLSPSLINPYNLLFAADHGIVEEKVSASPKEITWQQISNFLHGGAGINFLCRQHGFRLEIIDAGVDYDLPYEKGIIDKILTTNLVYQPDELLSKPWYINVDMSKYMALLIDTLNHDSSISDLLNPVDRIQKRVKEYNERYTK